MTRVIVDRDISPLERLTPFLDDDWEVEVGLESEPEPLIETLSDADIVLVTSRVPLTRAVIEASDLRLIGKIGTGIDSVDLEAARENGVPVTHTPGHNALSVAEHALCLSLATLRKLPEARRLVEEGRWRDEFSLGTRLAGSTVGLVGFGNVGKRVARLLTGFDAEILASDPYVSSIDGELVGATLCSLDTVLAESDVVVVTAELTEETRGMIGAAELAAMQESAVLVNVARGPVVDEDALVEALATDSIAGAGLDVFATEPLGSDHELLAFENVVLTPHTAAVTTAAREDNIDQLAENVRRLSAGGSVSDRYLAVSPDEC